MSKLIGLLAADAGRHLIEHVVDPNREVEASTVEIERGLQVVIENFLQAAAIDCIARNIAARADVSRLPRHAISVRVVSKRRLRFPMREGGARLIRLAGSIVDHDRAVRLRNERAELVQVRNIQRRFESADAGRKAIARGSVDARDFDAAQVDHCLSQLHDFTERATHDEVAEHTEVGAGIQNVGRAVGGDRVLHLDFEPIGSERQSADRSRRESQSR